MSRNENQHSPDEGDWPYTVADSGDHDAHELEVDTGVDVALDTDSAPVPQDAWFIAPPDRDSDRAPVEHRLARRLPGRGWAALAALAAVTVGVLAATHSTQHPGPRAARDTVVRASPAAATSVSGGACAGLKGAVVTSQGGDPAMVAGVISAFEYAYYVTRSAEAALALVAPEAALTAPGLAAGISSIPLGTTYCVAVTPIAAGAADVHLVELHPDKARVDYLQVIDTRPGPSGLLISHVQEQG